MIAEPVYNERIEAVASLRQAILQMSSQAADAAADEARVQTELAQAEAMYRRDLAQAEQRLAQVDGQIGNAEARSGHVVRASQPGRIAALKARKGELTDPGAPLAIILPVEGVLIAELYLPSRAIGFVRPGQDVKLMYDAFPYQKFGLATGTVHEVANVAQTPEEVGANTPSTDLMYKVVVVPDTDRVDAFGDDGPLQSGMELSADIVLEKRSLSEWLLEPVLSVR